MVSIIIPSYNKGKYIRETLESILRQSVEDWEAVIVDDGSTDQSIEIIQEYVKKDKRFKLEEPAKKNNGGSYCRNYGHARSNGTYVIFLDADDVLGKDCVKDRLEVFNAFPALDFIVFPLATFQYDIQHRTSVWQPTVIEPLSRFLRHELPWQTMQPIWKSSFVKTLNGFDASYQRMQDVEFHTRALIASRNFKTIDGEPDCFFRVEEQRIVLSATDFTRKFLLSSVQYYNDFKEFDDVGNLNSMLAEVLSVAIQKKNAGGITSKELKNMVREIGLMNLNGKSWLKLYFFIAATVPFHIPGLKKLVKALL